MKTEIIVFDENGTIRLARIIAKYCCEGFLVALNGELGAGKTRLVKEIGKELGVKETINSPTFNIVKCYDSGIIPFYHIDAYRLEGVKQDIGLEEFIEGDGVCFVEWSIFVDYLLSKEYLDINISIIDGDKRKFVIESIGSKYNRVVEGIVKLWK